MRYQGDLQTRGNGGYAGVTSEPTRELIRDFVGEAQSLVRQEIRLAKIELRDEAKTAGKASGSIGAGGAIAYGGFLAVMFGVVFALDAALPLWLSAVIVGVVVLAVGGLMAKAGMNKLKNMDKGPVETTQTLKEDRAWASEMMHGVRSRSRANA